MPLSIEGLYTAPMVVYQTVIPTSEGGSRGESIGVPYMCLLLETSYEGVLSATLHHFELIIALPITVVRLCHNFITAIKVSDLDF